MLRDRRITWRVGIVAACAIITVSGCSSPSPANRSQSDGDPQAEVTAALGRLNSRLAQHDIAIVDEFAADADVLLLGSEKDELAIGREQVRAHFEKVLAQPVTIAFDWKETRVSSLGDVAWVFASGDAVVQSGQDEQRLPYRLTGVLQRRDGTWKWRQFHGSEPAAPR